MPRYKTTVKGLDNVQRTLGRKNAGKMKGRIGRALEEGIEDMAEDSYEMAPKDTTALANSIKASIMQEAPLTWYYGSVMPYAQRQEYEHKSKKGYFRRSVNKNKGMVYERIVDITKDQLM